MKPVFAVDVGGVLASQSHDGDPSDDTRVVVRELAIVYDLHIVSMCGRNRALRTREWLTYYGLAEHFKDQHYIGFDKKNKNDVLVKIGATHFIDDRWKHIGPALMLNNVKCFHFCDEEDRIDGAILSKQYVWSPTWEEVLRGAL